MEAQQYATGLKIVIQFVDDNRVPIDISAATRTCIVYQKPSEETATSYWNAYFLTDGRDGKIYYRTLSKADIDESGIWKLEGYYEDASRSFAGHWHSSVTRLRVRPSLMEMEQMVGTSVENLVEAAVEAKAEEVFGTGGTAIAELGGTILIGETIDATPIELLTEAGNQISLERNATYSFDGVITAQDINNANNIFTEYVEGTIASGSIAELVSIKGMDSRVRAGSTIETVSTQQVEDLDTGNIAFMFVGEAGHRYSAKARINMLKVE